MIIGQTNPGAIDQDQWGKTPDACRILHVRDSRLYEILGNLAREDPQGLIKTFVLRAPNSSRGIRLFELNSLKLFMQWKYEQAQEEQKRREKARNKCPVIK